MKTAGYMSQLDRAWLLMERPSNPMVVVGLLVLDGVLEHARLREIVQERFLAFERFRSVPVMEAFSASWAPAEYFSIDDHVLLAALPAPAGKRELQDLAGELASTPLNTGRPLWTFHLVEHYQAGSAIVVRIHHCYADGIALMHVLMRLADDVSDSSAEPPPHGDLSAHPAQVTGFGSVGAISDLLGQTLRGSTELVEKGMHYAFHPVEAASAARQAIGIAGEVAHLGLLMPDDPPTQLKKTLSGSRRAAWVEPLALEEVRTLSHLLGCTINDVLVATLAGAMGRYLDSQGDRTDGLTIRATVPVNLRVEDGASPELGNRFGLVFVDLPVGIRHPIERLDCVHASMLALKGSSQALVTLGLLTLVGSLPAALEEPAVELFSAKASLVASNLRGPSEHLLLGGVPISQLLFWVPQAGSIGVGVSMLTYGGEVQFGVLADRQLIPEPGELVALIESEFERLMLLVLLASCSRGA